MKIEELGGSVEIATGIGLADAIFDIVSTGSTLLMERTQGDRSHHQSEAVLISNKNLSSCKNRVTRSVVIPYKGLQERAG